MNKTLELDILEMAVADTGRIKARSLINSIDLSMSKMKLVDEEEEQS